MSEEQDYKKKFPIGSKWVTRDGRCCEIIYHLDRYPSYPIVAVDIDTGYLYKYRADGKYLLYPPFDLDLIEPYTEPRRLKYKLYVYKNQYGIFTSTQRSIRPDDTLIDTIEGEWVEDVSRNDVS